MDGKAILVTGASSGIGEAVSKHFCKKGAVVIGAARNEEKLSQMAENIGDQFLYTVADLSDIANIQKVFDYCKEKDLKLDGIVHSAGVTLKQPIRINRVQQIQSIMNINFASLVEIVRLASSKRYTKDKASIVAISSISSLVGQKGGSLYAASKAAVNSFVKSASMELMLREIRINAIAPAMVDTPMYHRTTELISEIVADTEKQQPLGLIQPESVADLAEFLMTDKSKYITGTVIPINGGLVC